MTALSNVKIKPGTTPVLSAVINDIDITEATVYVTIYSGGDDYTKSNYFDDGTVSLDTIYDEVDGHFLGTEVTVKYTQEETVNMRPGHAKMQIGWVLEDGTADKTNLSRVYIPKTLIHHVMRYGRPVVEEE